jgi:hypothetical protein
VKKREGGWRGTERIGTKRKSLGVCDMAFYTGRRREASMMKTVMDGWRHAPHDKGIDNENGDGKVGRGGPTSRESGGEDIKSEAEEVERGARAKMVCTRSERDGR